MLKFRDLSGLRSFLLATALPLSALAMGLTSAHAGSDVQTGVAGPSGANGVNPGDPGGNGGDGGPADASAVNSDPLNSATATGGKGGFGGSGSAAAPEEQAALAAMRHPSRRPLSALPPP